MQRAGFQQQTNLANQEAELRRNQLVQQLLATGMSNEQAQAQANMQMEALAAQTSLGFQGLQANTALGYQQNQLTAAGGQLQADLGSAGYLTQGQGATASGLGGLLGGIVSDRRAKTSIATRKRASEEIDALLSNVKPESFTYKTQTRDNAGRWAGVMAQDLLKSKLGRTLVRKDNTMLEIDAKRAVSTLLATSARLGERVSKLEKAK